MNVLVADDDEFTRALLERHLQRWGFGTVHARTGIEALERLLEGATRLAIVDWSMPGMDGDEVCRRVREKDERNPPYIIILTGRNAKEDVVAGLKAGANDFVAKPFDENELYARLQVGERVVRLQSVLADQIAKLEDALAHIKTLQGILPICVHCHRIRSDHESWQRLEKYLQEHSEAQFSHGVCPECLVKYYPDAVE